MRDPDTSAPQKALALGVGNLLWADEGFGVRCVEALAQRYAIPAELEVLDGGTQGLYLVDLFRSYDPVVIFDAVDFGAPPGELVTVRDDAIPSFIAAHKLSLHQAGLQDVIACARLLGHCAERMLLIGVQPVELEDYGGSLRPEVAARIDPALQLARDYLSGFGIWLRARVDHESTASVVTPGLDRASYENGRPSPERAARHGDARVLNQVRGR